MSGRFGSAAAFRQSLEARVRAEAARRRTPINDLRQKLVMERLLARIFTGDHSPWLLKGGFAMELRYRPNARTTRDLDLSAVSPDADQSYTLETLWDLLQQAAEIDPGDYFAFRIQSPKRILPGQQPVVARFPTQVMLAGREYARFHIDAGFSDTTIGEPENLIGDGFFEFAGLEPAIVRAIPKAQQFAEKVHAMTYPWSDRTNTRVKDLVDLVVLIERGGLVALEVRNAIRATFASRGTHPIPPAIPDAPSGWASEFAPLAAEAGLAIDDVDRALVIVRAYWAESME